MKRVRSTCCCGRGPNRGIMLVATVTTTIPAVWRQGPGFGRGTIVVGK